MVRFPKRYSLTKHLYSSVLKRHNPSHRSLIQLCPNTPRWADNKSTWSFTFHLEFGSNFRYTKHPPPYGDISYPTTATTNPFGALEDRTSSSLTIRKTCVHPVTLWWLGRLNLHCQCSKNTRSRNRRPTAYTLSISLTHRKWLVKVRFILFLIFQHFINKTFRESLQKYSKQNFTGKHNSSSQNPSTNSELSPRNWEKKV